MSEYNDIFQRYLAPSNDLGPWGIEIHDLGWQQLQPGDPYPAGKHPESHQLNQRSGRILNEIQVVYVTQGRGTFWSEKSGEEEVRSGTVLILFKGVRHRYRPGKATGWKEFWIGFSGTYVEDLVTELFDPACPLVNVGSSPDLTRLFKDSCDLAEQEMMGYRQILVAKLLEALARIHVSQRHNLPEKTCYDDVIRQACCQMSEAIDQPISSLAMAKAAGMSHTSFRRHFKTVMGVSPTQYLLELRLRKAQSLIAQTTLPVQMIAEECGFDNPLYFSRFYKQRTGHSPSAARAMSAAP